MKTKIGTEVAHVTHMILTPLSRSKVKGQGHQAALTPNSIHLYDLLWICYITSCTTNPQQIV